jgi:PAS domain S-box-containing protein
LPASIALPILLGWLHHALVRLDLVPQHVATALLVVVLVVCFVALLVGSASVIQRLDDENQIVKERLELAVDGSQCGLWDWDVPTGEVFYSTSWKRMLGCSDDEVCGRFEEWLARLHPDDLNRAQETVQAYLGGDLSEYELEHRLRHKDGGYRWIVARGRLLRDDRGQPKRFSGFNIDVTELKEAQQRLARQAVELDEARRRAEQASQAKSLFLANVSHEIRTPMNGVVGMTQVLLGEHPTPVQRRCLETILRSAEALLVILDDILDFAKIEAGKIQIEAVDFAVRPRLDDLLTPLRQAIEARGLRFSLVVEPEVPEFVRGDPTRLGQILINLVGNAAKFTHEGEVAVRVALGTSTDCVRFEVADTGIGIARDQLERIFQPFEQADSSITRRYGGTGLGLAISARLVACLGGKLEVESEPGRGSRFWFEVPLPRVAAGNTVPALPPHLRPLRILVAEDNPINRDVVRSLLERHGHALVLVEDGRLALDALEREHFDVVLMDLHMPGMGGLETVRRWREREANRGWRTPVIALTARATRADREECLNAGMDDHVAKPIQLNDLLTAIARVVPDAVRPLTKSDINGVLSDLPFNLPAYMRGNKALLAKVVPAFVSHARKLLGDLRAALERGDLAGVEFSAHTLKGSVGNFGAQAAFNLAHDLEELARRRNLPDDVNQLVRRLELEVERLIPSLEAMLRPAAEDRDSA